MAASQESHSAPANRDDEGSDQESRCRRLYRDKSDREENGDDEEDTDEFCRGLHGPRLYSQRIGLTPEAPVFSIQARLIRAETAESILTVRALMGSTPHICIA